MFSWDPAKAELNLRKHDISFREATAAFSDPEALDDPDEKHSSVEERRVLVGRVADDLVVTVVYTRRATVKPRRQGSSARVPRAQKSGKHTIGKVRQIPDSEIDFSDIPELTDEQLRAMRPIGRPPVGDATKVPISFRINPNLLERIRAIAADRGESYQTFMHDLLEKAAKRHIRTR